jgi:hypothetical protein
LSALGRRVRLPIYVALSALLGVGCELLINLDGLDSHQCQANQKQCPGANPSCVSNDSIETSCADPTSCAPCAVPHARASCVNGACAYTCVFPYMDCQHLGDCQTNTDHDEKNCGNCGAGCSTVHGFPGCLGGHCVIGGCYSGWAHCDNSSAIACETNIWTDQKCGKDCGAGPCPSGTTCQQGACL